MHLLPLALIASALPSKPKVLGGAFGSAVSVTLVAGVPARAGAPPPSPAAPDLSALQQRLAKTGPTAAEAAPSPASSFPTRLSELFDASAQAPGASPAKGSPQPSAGGEDDPFARASVSYRGDDPVKAARLVAKVRSCAPAARGQRLLLIITSEGRLAARPRALRAASDKVLARAVSAVERCGPFSEIATPGAPRSYDVDLG